jgi:hypothetical protein
MHKHTAFVTVCFNLADLPPRSPGVAFFSLALLSLSAALRVLPFAAGGSAFLAVCTALIAPLVEFFQLVARYHVIIADLTHERVDEIQIIQCRYCGYV